MGHITLSRLIAPLSVAVAIGMAPSARAETPKDVLVIGHVAELQTLDPAQSVTIDDVVPDPSSLSTPALRQAAERALAYMDLTPGTAIRDITVDTVFIGSCTNGRLEDLRAAAEVARGRKVSPGVRALVVPGSARVKAEAEAEGLDKHFTDAGFEWRSAGCSMCLGMNGDILAPGERSASTSNRNFEGRQGPGGRTHLVSPAVAAATAVAGHFSLPGDL